MKRYSVLVCRYQLRGDDERPLLAVTLFRTIIGALIGLTCGNLLSTLAGAAGDTAAPRRCISSPPYSAWKTASFRSPPSLSAPRPVATPLWD